MTKKKLALRVISALVVLGVVGYLAVYLATVLFGGVGGDRTAALPQPLDQQLVQRGAYVAFEGDCAACHTAPGGKPFAGGLPLATPIGAVYSSNITPDKETGIGNYTFGDFERAVRRGITPRDHTLYPAMPYPSYARISDQDLQALYAFFMKGVQPVDQKNRQPGIPWPLSMRWPLTYWRWIYAPAVQPVVPLADADPVADRGAYLVEGLEHCGSCHTPRGIGLQEKALTPQGDQYLAGGVIDNYIASDLRGDNWGGLGAWTEDDIVRFLKSGRSDHTAAFGGMSDVVFDSTQHMTDADLKAIAHFLKKLPPSAGDHTFTYDQTVATALYHGDVSKTGALEYVNNCSACHLTSGKGYVDTFPALAGNPVVNAADPSSLIHIVLKGGTIPSTKAEPTHFSMPPFEARLSDQQVADVLSFIRSSWGNNAPAVDAAQVAKLRATLDPPTVAKSP
jgi:alcohol dehydrogenase (quinone), cytochrome c subunit